MSRINYLPKFACWLGLLSALLLLPGISDLSAAEMTARSLLEAYIEKIDKRHDNVTAALTVFRQGKFSQTRDLLSKATAADPSLPPAGILLTRMFVAAGQPNLARTELDRVTENHPDDPEGFLGIAEVAISEQRFADAELAIKKSSDLAKAKDLSSYRKKKMLQRVRMVLAAIAEQRKDWQGLAKQLQPIIDEDLGQPELVMRLARSRFRLGENEAAYTLLQKHWESDKDNIQRPEITVARLFQEEDNQEMAAQSMKLAAKRDSGSATQLLVATWALEQGDLELAQTCADTALAASKSSIQSRLIVALVARYKGEHEVAREMLESVHLESPANLAAVIELSIVLGDIKGKENTALQYAQLATKLQPNLKQPAGRNAAMSLAWILNKVGGRAQAEEIVRQVLAAGPVGVESSYYAAKIVLPGKNRSAAKQLLKSVVESDRNFPGYEDAKALYENTVW